MLTNKLLTQAFLLPGGLCLADPGLVLGTLISIGGAKASKVGFELASCSSDVKFAQLNVPQVLSFEVIRWHVFRTNQEKVAR